MTSIVDHVEMLAKIGQLAVCDVADYFILEMVEADGRARRAQVTSRHGRQAKVCDTLMKAGCTGPIAMVLDRREAILVERLSPDALTSPGLSADDASLLAAADLQSLVAVPLLIGASVIGVISLLASSASIKYGPDDVRLAEELARRAALAIANVRLYAETKRAVETRDHVLAIVSHDLRGPVVALEMAGHLLRRPGPIDEARVTRFGELVRRSVVEMNVLIDDLLNAARIQGGTLAIDRDRASLSDVVQPVLDRIRVQVEAKAIPVSEFAGAHRACLRLDVAGAGDQRNGRGPRSGDRQSHHRGPRWDDQRRERAWQGQRLLAFAARCRRISEPDGLIVAAGPPLSIMIAFRH